MNFENRNLEPLLKPICNVINHYLWRGDGVIQTQNFPLPVNLHIFNNLIY